MNKKNCIAMILAGGQGSRLGVLTKKVAKPAVQFGGKYRIIDFPLTNCTQSGIDTVGILTQYKPLELNTYIGNGQAWDLDVSDGGVFILPPYMREKEGEWYKGTANAIYQNMEFIDKFNPDHVLILSGDHIYKMDYNKMLQAHKKNNADCTIAMIPVPMSEASRFGILACDETGRITSFEEKPKQPKSNTASMGIYIFKWEALKRELTLDEQNKESQNDFGKNIIPKMLNDGQRLFGYGFTGYWKDVGTVESLWQANMDVLNGDEFDLDDDEWPILSKSTLMSPHFIADSAIVEDSLITEGCYINGTIKHSIIFDGVTVEKGAIVEDSVLLSGAHIHSGAKVVKAIVGDGAHVGANTIVGQGTNKDHISHYCSGGVSLVGPNVELGDNLSFAPDSMIVDSIKGGTK
ncbi:MAG: glucose-1-phosphate adenylyltransferase [Clostridia bacterium]|nr:glucose-1-phosphate adenylyltransferase [Clostridia bacterium]